MPNDCPGIVGFKAMSLKPLFIKLMISISKIESTALLALNITKRYHKNFGVKLMYSVGGRAMLKIPIARSPEATCFRPGRSTQRGR